MDCTSLALSAHIHLSTHDKGGHNGYTYYSGLYVTNSCILSNCLNRNWIYQESNTKCGNMNTLELQQIVCNQCFLVIWMFEEKISVPGASYIVYNLDIWLAKDYIKTGVYIIKNAVMDWSRYYMQQLKPYLTISLYCWICNYELVCIVQKSFNLLWCKKLYASNTW